MSARWNNEENQLIANLLVDGVTVDSVHEQLPYRSIGALEKKALQLNYRTQTSRVDRIKRFYLGIAHRNRRPTEVTTEDDNNILEPVESLDVDISEEIEAIPLVIETDETIVMMDETVVDDTDAIIDNTEANKDLEIIIDMLCKANSLKQESTDIVKYLLDKLSITAGIEHE
jgi:hypothetical protein